MKRKLSFAVLLLLIGEIVTQCSDSKNQRVFFNDMDASAVWTDRPSSNLIIPLQAHSGRYVCKLDANNSCSPTFYQQLVNIGPQPLHKINVEAWFYLKNKDCTPNIVVDLRDHQEHTIEYLSCDARDFSKDLNKWFLVSFPVDLQIRNRNIPDNFIRIYAINNSPNEVLVDDLKIVFE